MTCVHTFDFGEAGFISLAAKAVVAQGEGRGLDCGPRRVYFRWRYMKQTRLCVELLTLNMPRWLSFFLSLA